MIVKLNMFLVGFYINDKLRLLHNVERHRRSDEELEMNGVYVSQDNGEVVHVVGYTDKGIITVNMSDEDIGAARDRYLGGTVFDADDYEAFMDLGEGVYR